MASGKARNIDEIDDIAGMIQVMQALGIPWKGLNSLDGMKARVHEMQQSAKTPSWTAGQVGIIPSATQE